MKRILTLTLIVASAVLAFAQEASTSLVSFTGAEKVNIARSSIEVPSWHEKSFWPLYEQYVSSTEDISNRNLRLRKSLADLKNPLSKEDATSILEQLFKNDSEALAIKKDYFQKVSNDLNGIISLQFVQGEMVMDLMDDSKIYEQSPLRKYKFHLQARSDEQYRKSKHQVMTAALGLTQDNDFLFWNIYNVYEREVDNLLGKDYSLIGYYASDPNDFTPALAKRIGQDLLTFMERELKLKQKYCLQLQEVVGAQVAAKFFAWEDYYSVVSKMHAWAESQ